MNANMKELNDHISVTRQDYMMHELSEASIDSDPVKQFGTWMQEAIEAHVNEPTAMMLATVSVKAMPSARVVLLRNVGSEGFVFYTSYYSRKANDIDFNPNAGLTFFWPELQRQIRIEGRLFRVSEAESDAYFKSRPRENQLSAWVGQQSTTVTRKELALRLEVVKKKFEGQEVPRPHYWGGYCLQPSRIEFWQGRPARFHDRIAYTKTDGESWNITRLVP